MSRATILSAELVGPRIYGAETSTNFKEEWIGKTDMFYGKKTVSFIAAVDSPNTDHARIESLDLYVPDDNADSFSGVMGTREQFRSGKFRKVSDYVGSDYSPCIVCDGTELSISRAKFALTEDSLKYYLKYPHIYTWEEYSYMFGMMNNEKGLPAPTREDYDGYLENVSQSLNSKRGKFYIGKYHTLRDVQQLRYENHDILREEILTKPFGDDKEKC